jgi:diguanylate cyclase (GGDEF)-like protein
VAFVPPHSIREQDCKKSTMNLRTVFLLCFAAACLPAAGWSAFMAERAQAQWVQARAAVSMAKAMGDALQLVEALSIERGALQERALSDHPGVENLAEVAARNDALLDRTQKSMRAAGLPDEAVPRARAMLLDARALVAEAIKRPRAERDESFLPRMIVQLNERLDDVELAVARAEREAGRANASVGAVVAVGSLAVEMRSASGRRSTYLSGWMGGQPITPSQLDESMYVAGQVKHAWERLQRQVLIIGGSPRLEAAVAATRDSFFRDAEPRYREVLAIARAGGERPMSLTDWRRWTITALRGTLIARDAAIDEAVERGTALAVGAQEHLALAAAATVGMLLLAGGAFMVLLRRLVLPVQRLTAAVTRIAAGDVTADVPERGRHDEIGAMAAAIEVFRENVVTLRQTNLRFDAALRNMSQGLAMYDDEERLIVANPRLIEIAGLAPGSLRLGMTYSEVLAVDASGNFFPGRTLHEVYSEHRGFAASKGASVSLEEVRGKTVVAVLLRPLIDGGWLLTLEDITERRLNEKRIEYMAHHDALTGLPNRLLFHSRLDEALVRNRRGEGFALLYLDLDRFKAVNDTLGHPAGDTLLKTVTRRLRAELRETDTVARLGGDEFAVLQAAVDNPQQAALLAQRLIGALCAPYDICGHHVDIGVSIGISGVFGEAESSDALLKNADLALYRAKLDGRGTWRFFEPEMDAHMQTRRRLELDLRQAVAAEQFEMHYQPVVDLRTGQVSGLEALLRWRHPQQGLVSPSDFIPLAEETGLIGAIGEWVLWRACTDAVNWSKHVKIAVNISAVQFRAGNKLVAMLKTVLEASELPAARLELEVTETAMLQDTEETLATLHGMQALGVGIALDDFGTGYSSLSHLRRFPFNRVKIDRTFVSCLGQGENDSAAIVRAVIDLCAGLNVAVTAEGVETEQQLAWLVAERPIEAQGYLLGRPAPASAVPAMIDTQNFGGARAGLAA